jgi:hypothetical protein
VARASCPGTTDPQAPPPVTSSWARVRSMTPPVLTSRVQTGTDQRAGEPAWFGGFNARGAPATSTTATTDLPDEIAAASGPSWRWVDATAECAAAVAARRSATAVVVSRLRRAGLRGPPGAAGPRLFHVRCSSTAASTSSMQQRQASAAGGNQRPVMQAPQTKAAGRASRTSVRRRGASSPSEAASLDSFLLPVTRADPAARYLRSASPLPRP